MQNLLVMICLKEEGGAEAEKALAISKYDLVVATDDMMANYTC